MNRREIRNRTIKVGDLVYYQSEGRGRPFVSRQVRAIDQNPMLWHGRETRKAHLEGGEWMPLNRLSKTKEGASRALEEEMMHLRMQAGG